MHNQRLALFFPHQRVWTGKADVASPSQTDLTVWFLPLIIPSCEENPVRLILRQTLASPLASSNNKIWQLRCQSKLNMKGRRLFLHHRLLCVIMTVIALLLPLRGWTHWDHLSHCLLFKGERLLKLQMLPLSTSELAMLYQLSRKPGKRVRTWKEAKIASVLIALWTKMHNQCDT